MAKENLTIKLDGPLFAPNAIARLLDALDEGIEEVGEEGEGILMGFISKAGFQQSSMFLRSVDSEMRPRRFGLPATSVVTVTDDWAHMGAGRPTLTWFERGYRNGVRLRKGGWGFKNTAKRMNSFNFNEFFSDRIKRAIG